MFTGIIEMTGTLFDLTSRGGVRRITVEASGIAGRLREGDSLGVSGVCLTALDVGPTLFHADLAQETLDCTSLGALTPGAKVNLELPTAAGSPLGGHIVQGHRLDPEGARPRKSAPLDGAQRLSGRRGHQPDDCGV
jgi:riboflavin synthase